MSAARKKTLQAELPSSDRLVIFAFFAVGALAAFFGSLPIPWQGNPRLLLGCLLGVVLLLSVSAWGCVLLPLCSLLYGAFTERSALDSFVVGAGLKGVDWKILFCSAVLIPIFFLSSVHGMTVSTALHTALERGSPTARAVFHHELALVSIFILLGFVCIFYFY